MKLDCGEFDPRASLAEMAEALRSSSGPPCPPRPCDRCETLVEAQPCTAGTINGKDFDVVCGDCRALMVTDHRKFWDEGWARFPLNEYQGFRWDSLLAVLFAAAGIGGLLLLAFLIGCRDPSAQKSLDWRERSKWSPVDHGVPHENEKSPP